MQMQVPAQWSATQQASNLHGGCVGVEWMISFHQSCKVTFTTPVKCCIRTRIFCHETSYYNLDDTK
jgi:hypothetical protein